MNLAYVEKVDIDEVIVDVSTPIMTAIKDIGKMNCVIDEYNKNKGWVSDRTLYGDIAYLDLIQKARLFIERPEDDGKTILVLYLNEADSKLLHKIETFN